jgi:hypothetical protein
LTIKKSTYTLLLFLASLPLFGQTFIFKKKPAGNDAIEIKIIDFDSTLSDFKISLTPPNVTLSDNQLKGIISINDSTQKIIVITCDSKGGYATFLVPPIQLDDTLSISDLYLINNTFPTYRIHTTEYWKYPEQRKMKKGTADYDQKKINTDTTEYWKIKVNDRYTVIKVFLSSTINESIHLHGHKNNWWYYLRYKLYQNEPKRYIKTYHFIGNGEYIWKNKTFKLNNVDRK